ncbi:MAG TPA: HK97 family phage prohead protease [Novosphingobium sp.]|nr:HK97 family phage prohead protease [Novosphingobium sp.]
MRDFARKWAPGRKSGTDGLDRLDLGLELKLASDTGTISGYGSVFGLLDLGGDIVDPGAFTASLSAWRAKGMNIPMLWNHDPSTPIGTWTDVAEDEKGLRVTGQLTKGVAKAAEARALIEAKAVRGLSIGYRTLEDSVDRKTGARHLKEVDLWEISVVTFPMLPQAQIAGVKSFNPREAEAKFRAGGLSHSQAVMAVAVMKQILRDGGDEPENDPREGTKEVLMSLRRAAEMLRS